MKRAYFFRKHNFRGSEWKGAQGMKCFWQWKITVLLMIWRKTYKTLIEFPCLHPAVAYQWFTEITRGHLVWVMHCREHNGNGSLYCVDNDLSLTLCFGTTKHSNGIIWNRKEDRMYYVDSGRRCIEKSMLMIIWPGLFIFIRTAVRVPVEYGCPDGMTIDANGLCG